MQFKEFVTFLEEKLGGDLPGQSAQKNMAPYGTSHERFNPEYRLKAREGAVLLAFYEDDGNILFPLIRRPKYEGVHSGQIALPGGKKEKEDEDLIRTALREANEEIGIDSDQLSILGTLTELFIPVSNFKVLPVIACCHQKPFLVPDNYEVEEIIIADIQMLRQEAKATEIAVNNNVKLKAPYFEVNGSIVWGATAMILGELKEILTT